MVDINTQSDDEIEGIAIETAPNTEEVHVETDETDITVSVEENATNETVTIAGSAWDDEGIGVGGVAITLTDDGREQLIERIQEVEFDE